MTNLPLRGHEPREPLPCESQARVDRVHVDPERRRDLDGAAALDLHQAEHRALVVVERAQERLDQGDRLRVAAMLIAIGAGGAYIRLGERAQAVLFWAALAFGWMFTLPAIANALFSAVGLRFRRLPLLSEEI